MSFREKQRCERCIVVLNKLGVVFYVFAVLEVICYLLSIRIGDFVIRSISLRKYAVIIALTMIVGYILQQISNAINNHYVNKLKYGR